MSTPLSSGSDQGPGSPREKQRLDALRDLQVLDTPREATFDDLTALVADICQTPIALITLIDESRQWFKAAVGLTAEETPRNVAFCVHALDRPDLLLVPDAAQDPRFAANPLVTGEPRIRFYAGAPLVTPEGHTLGTLCVIDHVPRELNERQLTALRVLGRQVMTELQLRRRLLEFGRIEQALRQSESEQRALVKNLGAQRARLVEAQAVAKVGSWETDLATMVVIWSEEAHRIFETDPAIYAPTHARFLECVHPDDRAAVDRAFRESFVAREVQAVEHRLMLPDGRIKFILERWQVYGNESDQPVRAIGTCRDITERKMAELRLHRLNRLHAVLSKTGEVSLRTPDRQQLLEQICHLVVTEGLLRMAFIAEVDPVSGRIQPVASAGAGQEYLQDLIITTAGLHSQGTVGAAFRTGLPDVCNDFAGDPRMVPWRDSARRHGFGATASFPLTQGEAMVGVLVLFAAEPDFFQEDETRLMTAVASNLSFALTAQEKERQRGLVEEKLRDREALLSIAGRVAKMGGWTATVPEIVLLWSDETAMIHEEPPGFTPAVDVAINYYAPEYRKVIRHAFETCIREGTPFVVEAEIITARDRRIWVRSIGEAVRDATGAIIRVQGALQDISERKHAEAAQLKLAQRLATTLESITDGFFTLDGQWRFSYVNAEAERLILRQRSDLLGTTVWDAFPGTLGRTFERKYRHAVAEKVPVSFEDYYPPLDKWFEVRAYPSEVGLAVYFRDVTFARQAAQALRVSEERFRLLAKATNDAIWDWDLSTDALWWNEGFEVLFGFSRTEVESTIDSWLNRLHRDDQVAVVADVRRAIEGGAESWQGEYRFRRKDGRYADVLDRGHIIRGPDGKAVRMIGGMTDLTELKQADEKMREQAALLDHAHDAIMVRDVSHHITYWNKAAERLYGWTAAEAHGRRIHELFHLDADKFEEVGRAINATGSWNGEIQKTAKSGAVLTVEASWTLLRDNQGAPRSILTIDTDVTERKKLEQQFLRAQRMESIGTLAGGIAHDLNNLLAPITMGVDLLKLYGSNPKSMPVIESIERSARRGADLVKQVLSFARGVEGARVALQIRHVLKEIDSIVVNTFPKNIDFVASVPQELWTVLADPTQLNQVVLNLCVNARDAMPNGGRLELAASNVDIDPQYAVMNPGMVPGRFVMIQVTDTGIGIPKEITDRIFEPFFTTKELGKGTGLGLSTVLGIVRSHGGWVNVYSEVGRGSTFNVYLPALEEGEGPAADHLVAEAVSRGNSELILVVDDETSILDITKQTLVAFGYRVVTADDGAQAISIYALQRDEIALVLTDMMMPVMDGAMLILALQRINPCVLIIAASGLKGNHDVARATSAGVKHFLPKPYSANMLLRLVHQVLRNEDIRPPV